MCYRSTDAEGTDQGQEAGLLCRRLDVVVGRASTQIWSFHPAPRLYLQGLKELEQVKAGRVSA